MSEQHTPGPWIWRDEYKGLYGAGPNNEVLNYASYEGMWISYGQSRMANARLIAAAPELLEALQACIGPTTHLYHTTEDADGSIWDAVIKARAAIAKATASTADTGVVG